MSNELDISLPLDTRFITLPPIELRSEDDDLYKEYIEVREADDQGKSSLVSLKYAALLLVHLFMYVVGWCRQLTLLCFVIQMSILGLAQFEVDLVCDWLI